MKTSIISILFLMIVHVCTAQTINIPSTIIVSEGTKSLDDIPRNGFSVVLAGDEKDIIKAFEDFLEDRDKNYDIKSFFKKISGENLLVPSFSEKHFNLKAQTRESGSSIELWYWVSFGSDTFITSTEHPNEAAKCKQILKEFGQSYFTSFIEEDIEAANESMEKSQEELEDVRDDIADLTKDQVKEKKRKDKLTDKRLKLESKLAALKEGIAEKNTEVEKIDAEISLLNAKVQEKTTNKGNLETKVAQQEQTLKELKSKLEMIQNL